MGRAARGLVVAALAGACACACACGHAQHGGGDGAPAAAKQGPTAERVVADFERAVLAGEDAYAALFDFAAVGKVEKLLHRYDLRGRSELTDEQRAQFAAETPEPFSRERERRNLGHNFFPPLAQRTVGGGGCAAVPPIDPYALALGRPYEPLKPEDSAYEPLRQEVNAMIAGGGIVGVACEHGSGRLALVWTRRPDDPRGYVLITLYDDVGASPQSPR